MATVRVTAGDIAAEPADALVVNLFEGVTEPGGGTGAVDRALDGAISALIADGEVTGKQGETTVIHTFGRIPAKRVVVAGLGKQERFGTDTIRSVAASVARRLRGLNAARATSLAHGAGIGGVAPTAAAQALTEGTLLGLYEFTTYHGKQDKNGKRPEELVIVEQDPQRVSALEEGVAVGALLSESVALARTMVNEPPNIMFPERMAEIAEAVAKEVGLECLVLGVEEMQLRGMNALLGVTAGSRREPRLIALHYAGDPDHPDNNICLAGKGITFDTGGISLKPAENMGNMKSDMGGGASVIAAMRAIGLLRPPINVLGIVPAVENMPGGGAQRPSDIVRAMNGKTIEIENTDAEGRLVLADAISYAILERGAKRVVDIATLTGAVTIALGNVGNAVMGTSQGLVDTVLEASRETGEKMWQLPLWDEFREQNKSEWADVKNTGGRPAGSITAGLFIGEFTDGAEWAHLDIAGVALSSRERGHIVKGGTGVPTRTLVKLVELLSAPNDP